MKKKYIEIGAVIILLLFSLGLRLNSPTADLPPDISFSGSVYTDEGNQCHNSRSKILYDEWYPDDWRIKNYNPVVPYLKYAIFKVFGVGLVQIRAVSLLFAFLSLLVFFFTLRSYFNFGFSMVGTLLLGINYFYIMYNKIGTFETPMIFWMIFSLFFMEKFRTRQKSYLLVLAGMSAFMCFVFKNTGAHFIFVPFAAYVLFLIFGEPAEKPPLKKGIKDITLILGGILIVFILWLVLFYIPNREWIMSAPGKYIGNQMLPKTIKEAVGNFFGFNWKDQFFKIPIVWLSALLYMPLFFRRLLKHRTNLTEIGFFLFFLSHTLFFMFMSNRPTRYFVPVIPAMVFMTTLLFERMYNFSLEKNTVFTYGYGYRKGEYGILLFLDTLWLALGLNFCFIPLYSHYIQHVSRPPLSYKYIIFSFICVLLFYLVKSVYWKLLKDKFNLRIPLRCLFVFMLIFSVFINMKYYLKWNSSKTFTVFNISKELGKKLDNAYIMGLTAPVAVMENRHKSLFLYPKFVQWEKDIFDKYPLTHALVANIHGEIKMYFGQWPQKMSDANLLNVYNVKEQFLHLYSFVDPYMISCTKSGSNSNRYLVKVLNPQKQRVETWIGKIFYSSNPGCSLAIERDTFPILLEPGENIIPVEIDANPLAQINTNSAPGTLVFFLQNRRWENRFRYEGEKFPRRVGGEKKDLSASARFVRYYRSSNKNKIRKTGFMSYNPNFPLPFSQGFLIVDFYLKFSHIKSKIRPLCKLDIFPHREEEAFARKILKLKDVEENKFESYRLCTTIPETTYLEFRVYAEGLSDIELDYIDVTYFKGIIEKR